MHEQEVKSYDLRTSEHVGPREDCPYPVPVYECLLLWAWCFDVRCRDVAVLRLIDIHFEADHEAGVQRVVVARCRNDHGAPCVGGILGPGISTSHGG